METENKKERRHTVKHIIRLYLNQKIPFKIGDSYEGYREVTEMLGIETKKGRSYTIDKQHILSCLDFDINGRKWTYRGVTKELEKKEIPELTEIANAGIPDSSDDASHSSTRKISDMTYYIISSIYCNIKKEKEYTRTVNQLAKDLGFINKGKEFEPNSVSYIVYAMYCEVFNTAVHDRISRLIKRTGGSPLTNIFDIKKSYSVCIKDKRGNKNWTDATETDMKHIGYCVDKSKKKIQGTNKRTTSYIEFSKDNYSHDMYRRFRRRVSEVYEQYGEEMPISHKTIEQGTYFSYSIKYTFSVKEGRTLDEYTPRNANLTRTQANHVMSENMMTEFIRQWEKAEEQNIRNKKKAGASIEPLPANIPFLCYCMMKYLNDSSYSRYEMVEIMDMETSRGTVKKAGGKVYQKTYGKKYQMNLPTKYLRHQ